MRSKDPVGHSSDLTAAARIRDETISLVAKVGFGVSLRRITEAAGVSPGLVSHHFGSKEGLLETCDQYVLGEVARARERMATDGRSYRLLEFLAGEGSEVLVGYLVQALLAGVPLSRRIVAALVADAENYLAAGVAAGRIRESLDPPARAQYLAMSHLGAVLLHLRLELAARPDADPDFSAAVTELSRRDALPSLELFTHGLLTDDTLLSEHLSTPHSGAAGSVLE